VVQERHSGLALPNFAALSGAAFLLGARTVGEFTGQYIDDLAITTFLQPDPPCPAGPPPPPNLKFNAPALQGLKVTLTWEGNGTLQVADNVAGPYSNVAAAQIGNNSYTVDTVSAGASKFYRLTSP